MELKNLPINEYTALLEEKKSVPGGGSALALVLELAAALALMAGNFTLDKKGYESVQDEVKSLNAQLKVIKDKAHELIDEDGKAFNAVMQAFKNKNPQEIEEASLFGCEVPYRLYTLAKECENLSSRMIEIANKNLVSDAKCAKNLCKSIYPGCIENIKCNIDGVNKEKQSKFLALLEE